MMMQARSALISVIAASLCLIACEPADDAPLNRAAVTRVSDLSVADLAELWAEQNVRLIDVRTTEEVAEGMIPGAEHIAMDAFDPAALDLSDGREVVLYCRSGRRSRIVGERLAASTKKIAAHLEGGILAWKAAGKPVK